MLVQRIEAVETLGSYLKSKREALNITLEEMSQVTRIRRTILEAIENNRYDLMPPKVFAQGFIKSYASYLGLDASDVVKRYCEVVEVPDTNVIKKEQGNRVLSARFIFITLLVLGAGVLLVTALMFWMSPQVIKDVDVVESRQQVLSTSSVLTMSPLPDESAEGEGETVKETDQGTADSTSTISIEKSSEAAETAGQQSIEAKTEPLVLRIVASQETWMKIQSDRDSPVEVYLYSGKTYTAKAQEKFFIKIGNAGGVELFLNEQGLGKPGKPGEVIELTLPE